jgi:type II pantothenate kinase
MPIPEGTVGIDAGATLCKVVHHDQTLRTERYSSGDLPSVRRAVSERAPRFVLATGGGAEELGQEIGGVVVRRVPEFSAWGRGASILAARSGIALPPRYLLVSVGTGTSALAIEDGKVARAGGTALGGGTLIGLGRLLLGTESFSELVALAESGDRRTVDLLVGDIYRRGTPPLPAAVTAASFGKLRSTKAADVASALMGLLGENIGLICGGLAARVGADLVVYCGSTVSENAPLDATLTAVTRMSGADAIFLRDGAFCGAVGAAAHAED